MPPRWRRSPNSDIVTIDEMPNELPDPVRFSQDTAHASYDPDAVGRFLQILMNCDRVFKQFRTGFLGKASPVHFFWGSFDLAVTRFSGRRAPRHPGGVPHLPDAVAREAYSHEVSSAGFWPGAARVDYPAFYSYAYPEPPGFRTAKVRPDAAFFSEALGEFILPYDAVRTADDPDQALLDFLQSTYEAAANSAKWDRDALECDAGPARRGEAGLTALPRPTRMAGSRAAAVHARRSVGRNRLTETKRRTQVYTTDDDRSRAGMHVTAASAGGLDFSAARSQKSSPLVVFQVAAHRAYGAHDWPS